MLPNKSSDTCRRMFQIIKDGALRIGKIINPKCIQIDFEIGMIVAIRESFDNPLVKGCLFHFGLAIWRKVQNIGISDDYKNDIKIQETVRRICALALVPINYIDECWTIIYGEAPINGSKLFINTCNNV